MVRVKDADFIPPPPASLATDACDMVNTDARFKVKDVGKFNFFIC